MGARRIGGWLAAIVFTAGAFGRAPFLSAAGASNAAAAIALGDDAWGRRATGQSAGRATASPIEAAIAAYSEAQAADPAAIEAAWKLMRALWFQGEYVARTNAERQAIFERGRSVGESALERLLTAAGAPGKLGTIPATDLARQLAARPAAAPVFFWSAVHWGLWGDSFGRLAAARQGVATRIRQRCEVVLAIDETYENGGGHRVLGRLHALAPKVPFFTGWIDRQTAIRELRRAVALAPDDPLNSLYLAEAILDHAPRARAEAQTILRAVAEHAATQDQETEWARSKAVARERLAELSPP